MIFFEKLRLNSNGKEFMKTREHISKIFYLVIIIDYCVFWITNHPDNTPNISVYLTCVLSPLFVFVLFLRASYFLFIYNWLYSLYLIVTAIIFFVVLETINIPNYTIYLAYEIVILFMVSVIGVIVSIAVSLPFKMIHHFVLDSEKFYYNNNLLDELDRHLFPEKYLKEKTKKKEELKFDTMNETELTAEFNLALQEERYEDAEKIKKILEKKYR